ncbi:MAG: glycosyltransferase family 1 protein [bacterium]|nr:glycosyltransferase family 1 protein [bacterium]
MLRVFIDARKILDGGIGTYIWNLVDGLTSITDPENFGITMLIPKVASEQLQPRLSTLAWKPFCVMDDTRGYSLSEMVFLASRHQQLIAEHDIYHAPHYTLPYGIEIPAVVTVHDAIHVTHPDSLLHKTLGNRMIRSALARSAATITVSNASARAIRQIMPAVAERLFVIPNALKREYLEQPLSNVPKDYLLFVGSDRPHKGYRELLQALSRIVLVDGLLPGGMRPRLVAVGCRFSEETKVLEQKMVPEWEVIHPGAISEIELRMIYSGARGVVIPSREEGFGLVALEALASGIPVVATPVPCLKEYFSQEIEFAAGFSVEALSAAIERMLLTDDNDSRQKQRRAIASRFSIEEQARQTLEVYQACAGKTVDIASDSEDEEDMHCFQVKGAHLSAVKM